MSDSVTAVEQVCGRSQAALRRERLGRERLDRERFRRERLGRGTHCGREILCADPERGQVLLMGLFFLVGLTMAAVSVANVGIMVAEKIRVQNTADAAAYSAAVVQARYMNLTSYVNRAMIANYNSMAFNMGLWATVDAYDHGGAAAIGLIYELATIFSWTVVGGLKLSNGGKALDNSFHRATHAFNRLLKQSFGSSSGDKDLNKFIEMYNTNILSMYQGVLYTAAQSVRSEVMKRVAARMDEGVVTTTVLGLGAEAANYDELEKAVDYVVDTGADKNWIFDRLNKVFVAMTGEENDGNRAKYIGAVTEASLDRFTAGRTRSGETDTLRNFNTGQILRGADAIKDYFKYVICYPALAAYAAATWKSFTCYSDLDFRLGGEQRYINEDTVDQNRTPIVNKTRIRNVNFFGLTLRARIRLSKSGWINFGSLTGGSPDGDGFVRHGYTSAPREADARNFGNTFSSPQDCFVHIWGIPTNINRCTLGLLNAQLSAVWGGGLAPPSDTHWDGNRSNTYAVAADQVFQAGLAQIRMAEYAATVGIANRSKGVPPYEFKTSLDAVGFSKYYYPTTGAQARPNGNSRGTSGNLLVGPSIGVVSVLPAGDIPHMRGLGLGNQSPITAVSRSQVYYVRNPNRSAERPSLFNPHWAPRLAPIDAEDTPNLIRYGIPYLSSLGAPLEITH